MTDIMWKQSFNLKAKTTEISDAERFHREDIVKPAPKS